MIVGEVVAPELPAIGALLAAMALAIAWLAAHGMLTVWRRSLGRLLIWMADNLDKVSFSIATKTIRPLGALASMLRTMVNTVDHYLGEAVIWSGKGASTFFGFFLTINLWMAREIADLARDTAHALGMATTTTVNQVTKVVTHTVVKPITKSVTVVTKTSAAGVRALNHRVDVLSRRVAHLTAAAAGAIANPWPRLRGAERRIENQSKRLTKLERASIGAGAAALTLTALKRVGLGWLRCSNVNRAGKTICGMNPSVFESLLLDASVLTVAFNIEAFARELQSVTGEAAHLIRDFAE